jgi:hypothetical protein
MFNNIKAVLYVFYRIEIYKNKMRLLALDEKDTALFNSHVNRTLYTLYRENADSFTLMWEQQVTCFAIVGRYHHLRAKWLAFCKSLGAPHGLLVLGTPALNISHLSVVDACHYKYCWKNHLSLSLLFFFFFFFITPPWWWKSGCSKPVFRCLQYTITPRVKSSHHWCS